MDLSAFCALQHGSDHLRMSMASATGIATMAIDFAATPVKATVG
jgi:hypothetical protein